MQCVPHNYRGVKLILKEIMYELKLEIPINKKKKTFNIRKIIGMFLNT